MMDWQRQERIKKFLDDEIYDDYEGGVDETDLEVILLRFEHFLLHCEAERQKR